MNQHEVFAALSVLDQRRRGAGQELECDLRLSELSIFSQNGEDGVIEALTRALGVDVTYFVEFGVGDGSECNSRLLVDAFGWSGLYIEPDVACFEHLDRRYRYTSRVTCVNSSVTPGNINEIFDRHDVPRRFGLLSIDIDGQDYWVWESLDERYAPGIVVIECNTGYERSQAVVESRGLPWAEPHRASFGASVAALETLANLKGYRLVHVEQTGVNAFLVRDDLLVGGAVEVLGITERSPNYRFQGRGHPQHEPKPTVELNDRRGHSAGFAHPSRPTRP